MLTLRRMELSLEEAATKLGKSVRQVRYLVKLGKLPSRKVAGQIGRAHV